MLWKKNRTVAQTAGAPPNTGRTRRPISGSTLKRRKADIPIGRAKGKAAPNSGRARTMARAVMEPSERVDCVIVIGRKARSTEKNGSSTQGVGQPSEQEILWSGIVVRDEWTRASVCTKGVVS